MIKVTEGEGTKEGRKEGLLWINILHTRESVYFQFNEIKLIVKGKWRKLVEKRRHTDTDTDYVTPTHTQTHVFVFKLKPKVNVRLNYYLFEREEEGKLLFLC